MQSLTLKRGASFAAHAAYTPAAGQASSLAGLTFHSQVRTAAGMLIETLAVTVDTDGLGFTMSAPNGTAGWPTGSLLWDIKVTDGAVVSYSETVEISLENRVTA